jgi:hypothetical protein
MRRTGASVVVKDSIEDCLAFGRRLPTLIVTSVEVFYLVASP